MTEVKTQTMTNRYAQVLLAQHMASEVLDAVKAHKSEKISEFKDVTVAFKDAVKNADSTVLHFEARGKEVTEELTDTTLDGKSLPERIVGKFTVNDVDKLGKVVADQANGMIERAVKMSKDSKTNPNMKRFPKGHGAKAEKTLF